MRVMRVYSLIISAGLSSRFGSFKPLAPAEGTTFLHNIYCKVSSFSDKVIIVKGHRGELIDDEIKDKKMVKAVSVLNQDYEKGMFSSVISGLDHIFKEYRPPYHVLYQPVDIPFIRNRTYFELIRTINSHNPAVIKPSYSMKGGHPLILRDDVVEYILDHSRKTGNLRKLIKQSGFEVFYMDTEDKAVLKDIDKTSQL